MQMGNPFQPELPSTSHLQQHHSSKTMSKFNTITPDTLISSSLTKSNNLGKCFKLRSTYTKLEMSYKVTGVSAELDFLTERNSKAIRCFHAK